MGLSLRAWGPQSGQCPAAELQSQTTVLGEMDGSGCRLSIIGWGRDKFTEGFFFVGFFDGCS